MEHDEDYVRFFACMNFFVFSMLLVGFGWQPVALFVGWEGVGLASYLLIGYYYHRPCSGTSGHQGLCCQPHRRFRFAVGHLIDVLFVWHRQY